MWPADLVLVRAALVALLAGLGLMACGGSSQSPQAAATPTSVAPSLDSAAPPLAFAVDSNAKTVSFHLVSAHDRSNSGFNFNGYGKGQLAITVPAGWTVQVTCENRGPLNHSCAIVRGPADSQPAIPGAASPNPVAGQAAGMTTTFQFLAQGQGIYRIACLVPGHEQAGMWDTLTVTAASSQPSARIS